LTIDLSIILNVHDEATYLARTLQSTAECARYARSFGATLELVVVFDRPSAEVEGLLNRFTTSAFDHFKCLRVDNGSLGPSRNAGISAACGAFVTTCDADDLISFNAFAVSLDVARRMGPKTAVVPEFIFAFDQEDWVGCYSDDEAVTPLRFVLYNPFPARILAARQLLLAHPYSDIPVGGAYAFEDWHQNCELLAAGVRFSVAPDTILFYRRRSTSLSAVFDRTSPRVIPPSRFFHPAVFREAARPAYHRYQDAEALDADTAAVTQRLGFLKGTLCRELVYQASQIDPAIDVRRYDASRSYGTRAFPVVPGLAYYRLCAALGPNAVFSDVVFASGQSDDYTAWYMSEVLGALRAMEPATRVLVLAESAADLELLGRYLPADAVQVSFDGLELNLEKATIDVLVVKVMQTVASAARVHFARSGFATRFWRSFASVLPDARAILYRLGYVPDDLQGRSFAFDEDLDLISDRLPTLYALIADRESVLKGDLRRIGVMSARWHLLPPPVDHNSGARCQGASRHRVIWLWDASERPRPDVAALADAISAHGFRLMVDAWPALDRGAVTSDPCPVLAVSLSAAVDLNEVLCIVCTPAGAGMRRQLLEALGAGLPVVAAAGGCADDVVEHDRTGVLLPLSPRDDGFIAACADAIAGLARDGDRWARLADSARARMVADHTPRLFQACVKRILIDRH
jgi:glycosyltransferase involved in cell wall biosynthesis